MGWDHIVDLHTVCGPFKMAKEAGTKRPNCCIQVIVVSLDYLSIGLAKFCGEVMDGILSLMKYY